MIKLQKNILKQVQGESLKTVCEQCEQECNVVEGIGEEIFYNPMRMDGVGFRKIDTEESDCCHAPIVWQNDIKEADL